jgi:D-alanyl-D-alanine dipeptidase
MVKLINVVKLSQQLCLHPIGCELKYATIDNFVGRVIDGYHPDAKNICLLTEKIAKIFCQVQNHLIENYQLGLFVFDAYRPKRAVKDFIHWMHQAPAGQYELQQKNKHYPDIEKDQLFNLGYLAEDSDHCYGNTVDCVLQELKSKQLLDMGVIFDFFGEQSHSNKKADELGEMVYRHRQILAQAMQQFGFRVAHTEYWHFTHTSIKETNTPIDIPITPELEFVELL